MSENTENNSGYHAPRAEEIKVAVANMICQSPYGPTETDPEENQLP